MMAAKLPSKTAGAIFGARQGSSSSGSTRSIGPMLSMDLDVRLESGGFLGALSSDDFVIRLQSAEVIEHMLLPDNTIAASAALKAERPSATSISNGALSSKQQGGEIAKLTSEMEKLSTSEEIELLGEKFRISSGEWDPEYAIKPTNSTGMHPSMLWDVDSHLSSAGSGNVAVSQYSKSPTRNPQDSFAGPPRSLPLAPAPFKSPTECQAATTPLSQNPCLGLMHSSSSRNTNPSNFPGPQRNLPLAPAPFTPPPECQAATTPLSQNPCLGLMHSSSSRTTNPINFSGPPRSPPLALAPFTPPPECQAATTPLSQNPCSGLMHSSSSRNNNPMSFSGPARSPPLALAPFKSPPEYQAATTPLSENPKTCLGLLHSSSSRNNPTRDSLAVYPPLNSNPEAKAREDSKSTAPSSPKPLLKNLKSAKMIPAATIDKKRMRAGKKKKERRPRELDMTHAVKMTDRDILFGRGGKINNHPGNVYFRDKAIKFLPWYVDSSKEEKEKIVDVLLESVENEGRRFLEKKNGSWYKVIRGQHIKACATLRDLKDGMKESG